MKIISVLPFLFIAIFAQAQTKLIAHKSHSGSTKTFHKTLNDAFLGNNSNYGLSPMMVKDKTLDTVYVNGNEVEGIISIYMGSTSSKKYSYKSKSSKIYIDQVGKKNVNFKSKKEFKNYIASYMERKDFMNSPNDVFYKGFDKKKNKKELKKDLKKSERKKKSLGTKIENTEKKITKLEQNISKLRSKASLQTLELGNDVKKLEKKVEIERKKSMQLKNQLKRYQRKAARLKRQMGLK